MLGWLAVHTRLDVSDICLLDLFEIPLIKPIIVNIKLAFYLNILYTKGRLYFVF